MEDVKPIKTEPGVDSPSPAPDEDIYEDANDLEFYKPDTSGVGFDSMYLARIPQFLWKAWDKLDDDAVIELGWIRTYQQPDAQGIPRQRMRLLLKNDIPQHQGIPKEYNLDLQNGGEPSKNLFAFSEQDLPGYAEKNKARADALAAGIPASLLRKKEREEKPEEEQPKRRGKRKREEYFKRSIPKKTAIHGRIRHEIMCNPANNPEHDAYMQRIQAEANKPKTDINYGDVHKQKGMRVIGTGGVAGQDSASTFINTAPDAVALPKKVKKAELKTARMPENELLDQIFLKFREFRFWSMRSLRAKIPQPESYMRETLEKIAFLHRSGKWASNWELKPEHVTVDSAKGDAMAVEPVGDESGDEDLEDVKMEGASQ